MYYFLFIKLPYNTSSAIDMDFAGSSLRKISSPRSSNQGDIRSIFRPFNMNTMDNVSILFADIVGFTKMSSNKTASQLVGLLNDLFGRFDNLCTQVRIEKNIHFCHWNYQGDSLETQTKILGGMQNNSQKESKYAFDR